MNNLRVSEEDKAYVRKLYNCTEEDIKRDIKILKDWMGKQYHLPIGVQDDTFYETALIRNKCRVEKAKESIDSYYTMKTVYPDIYEKFDTLVPSEINERCLPLRPLTEDKVRYLFHNVKSPRSEDYDYKRFTIFCLAVCEILFKHDYSSGIHFVVDMSMYDASFLKTITPTTIYKLQKICQLGYANRIVHIDFYKPGPWIATLLNILKVVLPPKLRSRVRVIKDEETLLQTVPQRFLPRDYGGDERSIDELLEEWDEMFRSNRQIILDAQKYKSDESLRQGKSKYDVEIFGSDGTFKKINLD